MTRPPAATPMRLGEDLTMPVELVTRRTAVVGQTDTGKTSTAVVIVEEARKRGVQVVVIDPSGAWWGVTSSADGKSPGLDMVVLGGEHGDIPLNESAGRPVARLVAEHGVSPVLDLDRPHFRSWAGRQRFVADFLSELYEVIRGHVLIVIDEAHRFAPQAVRDEGGDVARCLGAVTDAVALGRRRGMSVLVITQRLAKLHKDVLELCEVMVAHRLRGNNDLAQLRGWVENVGEDWKAIRGEVVALERGVARVSAPTLGVEGIYRIRPKWTFDSSRTVAPGEVTITPTTSTQADLEALRTVMAETIEEARADDPKVLREELRAAEGRVVKLAAELAIANRNLERPPVLESDTLICSDCQAVATERCRHEGHGYTTLEDLLDSYSSPPPSVPEGLIDAAVQAVGSMRASASARRQAAGVDENVAEWLERALKDPSIPPVTFTSSGSDDGAARSAPSEPDEVQRRTASARPAADDESRDSGPNGATRAPSSSPAGDGNAVDAGGARAQPASPNVNGVDLVAGARRMLDVLGRYGPLTRAELATLAHSHGGSQRTNLSALRTEGLIEEEGGRVHLTDAGNALGPWGLPFTSDEIVASYERGRRPLVAGARRILSVLMRAPGKGFTRGELEGLARSHGGSFRTNLSALRTRGLIEERNRRVYPNHVLYYEQIEERRR